MEQRLYPVAQFDQVDVAVEVRSLDIGLHRHALGLSRQWLDSMGGSSQTDGYEPGFERLSSTVLSALQRHKKWLRRFRPYPQGHCARDRAHRWSGCHPTIAAEEWEAWLTAPPMDAVGLQRPLPDGSLVVVRGEQGGRRAVRLTQGRRAIRWQSIAARK
jgi:hypothetical protein